MKQSKHDVMRLLTIMFTIAAIGALSTSSMSAYAMSSPSVTSSPSPMLQSSPNNAIVLTTSIDGTAPHDDVRVSLAEPTVVIGWGALLPGTPATPNANPPPGGTCTLPSVQANPNNRELWYFQSGGVDVTFDLGNTAGAMGAVTIPFKPGVVAVALSGVSSSSSPTGSWVPQVGAKAPSVDFATSGINLYGAGHCGYDLILMTGQNNIYGTVSTIGAVEPIGGEILAINTAALLIAGLTTSAFWMIPAVGAVAGTAVTFYKLRQK